jgi:hypothetical protein
MMTGHGIGDQPPQRAEALDNELGAGRRVIDPSASASQPLLEGLGCKSAWNS